MLFTLGGARSAGLVAETVVVHREQDDAIRALAGEYRCLPVAVRDPDGELSLSIRTGLEMVTTLAPRGERQAALICLGDQPLIRLDVIRALVETWARNFVPAVRPAYRDDPGRPGHPILIDRSLWPLAAELRGDSGFGTLLDLRRIPVRAISVAGSNPDVDTPEQLRALDRPEDSVPERSSL